MLSVKDRAHKTEETRVVTGSTIRENSSRMCALEVPVVTERKVEVNEKPGEATKLLEILCCRHPTTEAPTRLSKHVS